MAQKKTPPFLNRPSFFPPDCASVTAPNLLPRPDKPYYTPADQSLWKLPRGSCRSPADVAAAKVKTTPFVAQGVSAKPDIHPAFFTPLPDAFADGCEWLSTSTNPAQVSPARLQAMFDHGVAAGLGWADANGYCA